MVYEGKNISDTETEQYLPDWLKKLRELLKKEINKEKINEVSLEQDRVL